IAWCCRGSSRIYHRYWHRCLDRAGKLQCSGGAALQRVPSGAGGERGCGAAVSHCPHVAAATRPTGYHLEGRVRVIKLEKVSRLYPAKAEENGGNIRALDDFSLT